jgi:putative membrane protein
MGAGAGNTWANSGSGAGSSASAMKFLMNGYQGPLTASDFSTYTTAQSFIPMAGMNGMREVELSQVAQSKAKSAEVRAFAAKMIADHTASNEQLKSLASSKNVSQSYGSTTTAGSVNASGTAGLTSSADHSAMGAGNTSAGMGATGSASTSGSVGTSNSEGMSATGTAGTAGATASSTAASDHTAVSSNAGAANDVNSGMNNNTASMSNSSSQNNDMASLQNLTGQAFDVQYMRMMLQDHQKAIELFTSASQSTDPEVRAFASKTLPTLRMHYNHARHVNNVAHLKDGAQ